MPPAPEPDPINTAYVMTTGDNTAIRLFWKKSTASPEPAVDSSGYIVKISSNSGSYYSTITPNTVVNPNNGDLCYSDIAGLNSNTSYMFKVLAKNVNGTSNINDTFAAINTNDIVTPLRTISPSVIPGKPLLFGSDNADGSGVTLNWYPYPDGVTFTVRDVTSNDELIIPDNLTTNTLHITVDVPGDAPNLVMGNTYTFSVQAVSNNNYSSVASVDIIPTDVPTAPSISVIDQKDINNPKLKISWTAPENNGKSILGYSLYISEDDLIYTPILSYNLENPDPTYVLDVLNLYGSGITEYEIIPESYGTRYYYILTATNANGESEQGIPQSAIPTRKPSNVEVTDITDNHDSTVTIIWNVPNFYGAEESDPNYTICWETENTSSSDSVNITTSPRQYTIENLQFGIQYYIFVIAHSASGDSDSYYYYNERGNGISFTGPPDTPSISIINTHNESYGTLTLSWEEPNNNGSNITKYWIYKSEDGGNVYDNGTAYDNYVIENNIINYTATGLTNGELYHFKVKSENSVGPSIIFSNVVYLIALIPPTLQIINNNDTSLTLTWSAVNGEGTTGYDIYRSLEENGEYTKINDQGDPNATTFTYTCNGLSFGTRYYFKAVATSNITDSEFSNIVSGVSRAPSDPPVLEYYFDGIDYGLENNHNSNLTLHWTRPNENGTEITGYNIYIYNSNSEEYDLFDNVSGPTNLSYQATGLTLGTNYYFKIVSTSDAGDSSFSNIVYGRSMAPPNAPVLSYYFNSADQGLENNNNGTLTLHWLTPTENGTSVIDYNVYMSTEENGEYTTIAEGFTPVDSNNIYYLINSNIYTGTTYYFKIVATSDAGNSAFSNIVNGSPRSPPNSPYIVGIDTSNNNRTLTLFWVDTSLNGSTISTYEIYYSLSHDDGYQLLDSNFDLIYNEYSSLIYTTNQLANGTYYFKIRSISNAGDSEYSNIVSGLAIEVAPSPNAPTATPANPNIDLGGVYVEWNDQSYDTTNLITGYYVTYYWNDGGQRESYRAGVFYESPAHITGLTTNISYTFTLTAVNDAGESSESLESNPITLPFACVIGSTKILMGNGEYLQIKDIKIGDVILEDITTRKTNIVSRIVKNNVKALGKLIPKGLIENTDKIICARNHPIWINNDKNRIKAKHIKGTKRVLINEPLYNIQYDDFGTFYAEGIKMDSLPPVNNIDSLPLNMYLDKSKYYTERSDNGPEFITLYQPTIKKNSI